MVSIDSFEPIEVKVPLVGDYSLSSFNKAIINGKPKKKNLNESLETLVKQLMG